MHIGNVFRRNSISQTISSSLGVGSGSISWQGYEVITGRITSQSLGFIPFLLTKCTVFNLADFIVSVPRFNIYRGRVSHVNLNACYKRKYI